jgi:hypothetical protein
MAKEYIGSDEHWIDAVNARYDAEEDQKNQTEKEINEQILENGIPEHFTVIEKDERVDFNIHSFKEVKSMVYLCTSCGCYHVKALYKEQYQEYIYELFSENPKLGEMSHLDKYYD